MINYNYIAEANKFYENKGYLNIESPWTVSEAIDNITKPSDRISFKLSHNDKCLVASGEQSFLYLYLKGFLPKGQFQTTTPCFRNESFDLLHTKYFIKTELIKTDVVTDEALNQMIQISLEFYQKYLPGVYIVNTDIGYDIMYEDNELGSYGIRHCDFLSWIYGTGVAEPRLSRVISLNKNKRNGISY